MHASQPPLQLALVWHMHQPDYVDPLSGERFMPWTRLHALKDYADMAHHLDRHPGVRATFNVVPALLTELPVEIIDEMDAVDFAAVSEVIAGFCLRGP